MSMQKNYNEVYNLHRTSVSSERRATPPKKLGNADCTFLMLQDLNLQRHSD